MIFFKRLIKDASGVTAIEYGLVAALIVVGSLISIQLTGVNLNLQGTFGTVAAKLSNLGRRDLRHPWNLPSRQKVALISKITAAKPLSSRHELGLDEARRTCIREWPSLVTTSVQVPSLHQAVRPSLASGSCSWNVSESRKSSLERGDTSKLAKEGRGPRHVGPGRRSVR